MTALIALRLLGEVAELVREGYADTVAVEIVASRYDIGPEKLGAAFRLVLLALAQVDLTAVR